MPAETSFPTYSIAGNSFGYLGRPLRNDASAADVAVVGVPYDMGTSGRAGTRHGPQGIRMASSNLRWEEKRWPWRFNLSDRLEIVDCGDLAFPPGESERMVDALEQVVASHLEAGRHVLTFGGDHFITLPLLRAHSRFRGGPVRMIHFDAPTDHEATEES
ncbi:MAG: agmatinase, partial [Proteobacteria bacterium]